MKYLFNNIKYIITFKLMKISKDFTAQRHVNHNLNVDRIILKVKTKIMLKVLKLNVSTINQRAEDI